jgi:hypothetical protein
MIRLEISATDAADFHGQLAGIGGKSTLSSVATEALIEELRERMAKKGHSVEIEPFPPFEGAPTQPPDPAPKETGAVAAAPVPNKRGPKSKSKETPPTPEGAGNTTIPDNSDNSSDSAGASVQNSTPADHKDVIEEAPIHLRFGVIPTREDVIAALNTYAAPRGGQVAGRQKMKEIVGADRLQDVKPEDYAKLVAGLQAAA